MKINRAFIRGTNCALAGLISMLGFTTGCEKEARMEYGTPNADYTVKGTVVNKADGKPIEGIQVAYYTPSTGIIPMYGVISAPYKPKTSVTTDAKGEFKLKSNFSISELLPDENGLVTVFVEDIDGEKNGLFQSDYLKVDFSKAEHSGKQKNWYEGEYTVNVKVELTEIKDQ